MKRTISTSGVSSMGATVVISDSSDVEFEVESLCLLFRSVLNARTVLDGSVSFGVPSICSIKEPARPAAQNIIARIENALLKRKRV